MQQSTRSAAMLVNKILSDPDIMAKVQGNPQAELPKVAQQVMRDAPLDWDCWIYRIVVLSLGMTLLAVVIGVIVLAGINANSHEFRTPEMLTAIGSGAVGALAGLLAPSPANKK